MNKPFWSLARQRKFDFCRRAFFLQYHIIDPDISVLLRSDIEQGQRERQHEFLFRNFTIHCLRRSFYNRSGSDKELKDNLYKEGYKWGLERPEIKIVDQQVQSFKQSLFFSETAPCLVHHLPSDDVESLAVGDVTVQGVAHFVWLDKSARLHIVN